MKILIACEFSGEVRDAFIARGHDAISCDILPTEKPGPHYQGDVRDILNDNWDMIIAFPPCTYLANSGVIHLSDKDEMKALIRWDKMIDACLFFNLFDYDHPCRHICIENPIQHGYARRYIRKYDQIIQPWQFGHEVQKATCLWLKGLPLLTPTNIVDRGPIYIQKNGKKRGGAFHMLMPGGKNQSKNRSRTFPGIAAAMATQWG